MSNSNTLADFVANPVEFFDKEEQLYKKRFEKLKKDQAEHGVVYQEKGSWFFRDGTELTFEEAFGAPFNFKEESKKEQLQP